jgi:hypothetical protein
MRFDFTHAPPQFGRRQTFLRGVIHAHGRLPSICAVRELTPTGATLVVASSSQLPNRFRLVVQAKGIDADCGFVERLNDAVEVVFI